MQTLPLGYLTTKKSNPIGFAREKEPPPASPLIYDSGEANLLTIAPTGAGKGRGNIIPTCLSYKGSLIVLDVKGEAAKITAKARRKFGKVYIVDPFKKVTRTPARFNPMDIAMDPSCVEQQGIMIAKAFQPDNGTYSADPYWDNTAHELLSAVCIHALTSGKSFTDMRRILFAEDVTYKLALMLDNKEIRNPLAIELVRAFLQIPETPTRNCVLSSVHQHLGILGDPVVLESLEGPSSFNIQSLVNGEPITIYFVIPPNKLAAYSVLLRLWFTSLLYLFTERTTRPKLPTLLIIDECSNLGKLDGLMSAITLMRCYGLRIWCMFQSVAQIKDKYKSEWLTIIDNCDVIQAYGFKHFPTAKEMSEIIGGISAAELLCMPRENAILMRAGMPVATIKRLDYLKDELFKNSGFQKNPFYAFSKI